MSIIICADCYYPIYTKKEKVYPSGKWSLAKPSGEIVSEGYMRNKCRHCYNKGEK